MILQYKGFTGSVSCDDDGYYGYIQGTRIHYASDSLKDLELAFQYQVDWLQTRDNLWSEIFRTDYRY